MSVGETPVSIGLGQYTAPRAGVSINRARLAPTGIQCISIIVTTHSPITWLPICRPARLVHRTGFHAATRPRCRAGNCGTRSSQFSA